MEEQDIPADRFSYQSISLEAPDAETLVAAAGNGKSYLPKNVKSPAAGDHMSRAVAKAIYANASSGVLGDALSEFVAQVQGTELPSRVMVCFNLAGGTGSGMAVDLARDLAGKLGSDVPVIGVGQMPHSGDGDAPAILYASLTEFACMTDDAKNADATKGEEGYGNPFSGGFFVVNTEHSWQRLTSYTTTGEPGIRDRIRQEVVNKFAQDSFMRFAMRDTDGALNQALAAAGLMGDASAAGQPNSWVLYNLAKFTHPGVQVLPRRGDQQVAQRDRPVGRLSRQVLRRGRGFSRELCGRSRALPRTIGFERLNAAIESKLAENFLKSGDAFGHSDIQPRVLRSSHGLRGHRTAGTGGLRLDGLRGSPGRLRGSGGGGEEGLPLVAPGEGRPCCRAESRSGRRGHRSGGRTRDCPNLVRRRFRIHDTLRGCASSHLKPGFVLCRGKRRRTERRECGFLLRRKVIQPSLSRRPTSTGPAAPDSWWEAASDGLRLPQPGIARTRWACCCCRRRGSGTE